jgi:hypothetical protein
MTNVKEKVEGRSGEAQQKLRINKQIKVCASPLLPSIIIVILSFRTKPTKEA